MTLLGSAGPFKADNVVSINGVIIIDINDLKSVNDTRGPEWDALIRQAVPSYRGKQFGDCAVFA